MAKIELPNWLPNNRRDFLLLLGGAALSLGVSSIPGVTLEPAHCTECRADLLACQKLLTEAETDEEAEKQECKARVEKAWTAYADLKRACDTRFP